MRVFMSAIAILLAAGSSTRFKSDKLWETLGGQPVIQHSLHTLAHHPDIGQVVVVCPAARHAEITAIGKNLSAHIVAVEGGDTRCDSAWSALRLLQQENTDGATRVLIHDAARPLVGTQLVTDCLSALQSHRAVCPVAPITDTVVQHDGATLMAPLRRTDLGACQTPQGFEFALIYKAHKALQAQRREGADLSEITDDCSALLHHRPTETIAVVPAPRENIKITQPLDLRLAEWLLQEIR